MRNGTAGRRDGGSAGNDKGSAAISALPVSSSPRLPVSSPADPPTRRSADSLDVDFVELRPYLFAVAYRMLGSATEAEDMVQETYLRLHSAPANDGDGIVSPKAYLTTILTRLCLDHLKSARVRREQYTGPWLPEPVPTADAAPDPSREVEQREAISLASLALLERLNPPERAVYVLREAFAYDYDEIGEIIGKSSAATRQILHRAREHVTEQKPRFAPSPDEHRRLTERFLAAAEGGDLKTLTAMFAEDITLWTDGGGQVRAAVRPVHSQAILSYIGNLPRLIEQGLSTTIQEVNGGPAALFWAGSELRFVMELEVAAGQIAAMRVVANPDKLAYLARRLGSPRDARPFVPSDDRDQQANGSSLPPD